MALRSIKIMLGQINDDSFKKIKLYHSRIDSYAQMGAISEQIDYSVTELRDELNEKLKMPFLEFLQRDIPYLKDKNHYKYIPYSIEKFENLSLYAL
jgi:hypothetical protein